MTLMRVKRLFNLAGNRLHALPLLILYLTDGCNSRCITCDIWRNPRRNMPLALAESIAESCAELGVRWLLLSGGEAMQHPQWSRIAQRFQQEGVHVMLLTNGLSLRKDAKAVAESVDEVIVSLDAGNAATYKAIRGVDAFDVVLDGIDAVRAHGIPVTTRTTVQRDNFREIPQIIETGLAHDASAISFLAVDVSSDEAFGTRSQQPPGALTADDIPHLEAILDSIEQDYADVFARGQIAESPQKLRRTLLTYFHALIDDRVRYPAPRCNAPHISTVIDVDGTLRPCYFLPAYGQLKPDGDRLPQAINWNAAQDLRAAYKNGQRPECKRCVCPLYKGVRSLWQM
jgi:MoaA/NifB/PqqE/SkfB family radical SAM enzyme